MEAYRQQNIKTHHSPEPQSSSPSLSLGPRRVLRETNSNPQTCAPESTDLGQAKPAVFSQPAGTSILERRRKPGARARQIYPVQRVQQYQQYRARQRRDAGSEGDPVWPDELEDAFIEALYKVPPIGRRKLSLHRKPCGRNELISEYILKKTGVRRCRKQVSSHIQVLKGFMGNDAEFTKLVTSKESPSSLDEIPFTDSEMARLFTSNNASLESQEYDLSSGKPSDAGSGFFVDPHFVSSIQASVWPLTFAVWLQASGQDAALERSLHTYTSLIPERQLPSTSLESFPHWKSRFPHLATLHQDGAVNSQIILFDVSFDMMTILPSNPAYLCTQFEIASSDAYACHTWECNTKIYKYGKRVRDRSQSVFQVDNLDGTSKLILPFASNFWSATFTTTFNTRQNSSSHCSENEDVEDDEAMSAIQGISVVQELFATSTIRRSAPKRVALFLWEFKRATPGEAGGVTWRNLIPPPLRILTNSPSPVHPHGLNSSGHGDSDVQQIEQWEPPAILSASFCDESHGQHAYSQTTSPPLEIVPSNPAYYGSFSNGVSQEGVQASLGDAGQFNYLPFDSSVPYFTLPDDLQQYMSQWQQYLPPFLDSQFPISISY
ncbi:hypothetical protein GP486_003593 [Trichoglossum hirsutum]|uniref:TEA domain-containing protein n=1 Tax=Trichoglossum hirsutum TaxID=265104 RepID=A0A9P8RQZ5_9PEZI|nr:hypothetical protein GP486_003593 [Trichoglossum hirsutum]